MASRSPKTEASKLVPMVAVAAARLTVLPPGIGPLYRLCKKCRGSGDGPGGERKGCAECEGIGEVLS